jgi:hypothetical protein
MVCQVKSESVGRHTHDPKKERREIRLTTFDTVLVKRKKEAKKKMKNALGYGKP